MLHHEAGRGPFALASHFRDDFFDCLTVRGDALFELADALLCKDGPVTAPVDLTLTAEHRRGHGAMYSALNRGEIDVPRLRQVLAGLPQPRAADGRLVLAVDVTHWLRPDASTSPERLFCHVYGRSGRSSDQFVPGWPYSFVAALETGRTSWCQLLDAVRLGPADDVAEVTAAQVRRIVEDLIGMGRWKTGDREVLVVFDAGYDAPRMAHLLAGLPVEVLGRMRADRVMRRPAPSREEFHLAHPYGGRPPKHGGEFRFAKPETWGDPDAATVQVTDRYGTARAMAWNRIHPRLTTRSAWIDHTAELPVIEGTQIRLQVDRLPGGNDPLPVWLWSSATGLAGDDIDIRWQAFLRRFDLEHTFRMIKQTLGWTRPKLRAPAAADRWTWLVIAAHTQLRLLREAAGDLRHPWERPAQPGRLTPARVRRGFRNLRPHLTCPARAPKPSRPGPGRPPGSKNRHPATHHNVGKTAKRPESIKERSRTGG
ncbi:transposase [Streptomyces sp. NBC_01808]|uniref:NF041680 family putative transposase n=1 Tax=Streptomyces sp. NBC_01808 TaxID=2975947 RepID=UPI002DDBB655|nr:NF041680 family putative transposase [Streptomyces sp. NBC_01808]WSA39791.1 transposase [Streptomyces sp. NBC_01808]WSA40340.1 transposase [Streptomyces sp. NBC_01808]WSA41666.1 transposase [Streptomyces sp. NBC_01808]